jgi:hypothetical protein
MVRWPLMPEHINQTRFRGLEAQTEQRPEGPLNDLWILVRLGVIALLLVVVTALVRWSAL